MAVCGRPQVARDGTSLAPTCVSSPPGPGVQFCRGSFLGRGPVTPVAGGQSKQAMNKAAFHREPRLGPPTHTHWQGKGRTGFSAWPGRKYKPSKSSSPNENSTRRWDCAAGHRPGDSHTQTWLDHSKPWLLGVVLFVVGFLKKNFRASLGGFAKIGDADPQLPGSRGPIQGDREAAASSPGVSGRDEGGGWRDLQTEVTSSRLGLPRRWRRVGRALSPSPT